MSSNVSKPSNTFCRRTRREFLWQAGAGFAGVAMAGLLDKDGFFARNANVDFDVYEIGSNLIWSPVAGLDIGVEVLYRKVAADNGRIQIQETTAPGVLGLTEFKRSEDQFQARLRIQRDF